MTPPQHLPALLRSYMDARGLTQAEAARACGFNDSQMSSLMLRPRKKFLDPDTLLKLYTGLGVPVRETMNAVAQDVGVGPLIDEELEVSEDPEAHALAQVISTMPPEERRALTLLAASHRRSN